MTNLSDEQRVYLQEMARRGLTIPFPSRDPSRYRERPSAFCRDILGATLWSGQERIARALLHHRRVAVRSCHNSGKTHCAAALVNWFVQTHRPSLVITTAPTQRQVRDQLWKEIGRHHRASGLPGSLNQLSLVVSDEQRALGFTTNEPERFQGWHEEHLLAIVDEASGVEESIYEALEGILTGPHARLLLIGNPNFPAGTFFEAFGSDLYYPIHISAHDVPQHLLPPSWAAERLVEWGEENPAYQVRVLGEFPDQAEDALFRLSWITAAQEAEFEPEPDQRVEIGVDIARFGSDESVAVVRQGRSVLAMECWRGADTMATAGRIAMLWRRHQARLVKVDEIGVGAGVLDRLKADRVPASGVNVGMAARDTENYANLRAELYQGLSDRFKRGEIAIPKGDQKLVGQLVSLRYGFTPKGQKKLESKDDMRKRGLPSPDRADALMLAFARPGPSLVMGADVGPERPR